MTGTARVDHRAGKPKLSTDLRIEGARLEQLVTDAKDATGPLRARIVLSGSGDTIRTALASASGRAALVVRDGTLRAPLAAAVGQDIGRAIGALIAHPHEQRPMRCVIADFRGNGGVLRPSPLAIDAGTSRADGRGAVRLENETIALALSGASKGGGSLSMIDPIRIEGTFSRPAVVLAPRGKKDKGPVRNLLGGIARSISAAIDGDEKPQATPVDCDGLARRALQ